MNTLTKIVRNVESGVKRNKAGICTGISICGTVTAVIFAIEGTPKAIELLNAKEQEKGEPLTVVEKVKTAWRPYAPATAATIIAIGSAILSHTTHHKRVVALTTACEMAQQTITCYDNAIKKLEPTVVNELKKDISNNQIAMASDEKTLKKIAAEPAFAQFDDRTCLIMEPITGQIIKTSRSVVEHARNKVNEAILEDGYTSLSLFFSNIGVNNADIGDIFGWCSETDGMIDIDLNDADITPDGYPCLVINYNKGPHVDYSYWN